MNIYFSKVIKAGEKQREFNFRQYKRLDENSYAIDVPDDKGQRIAFFMNKDVDGVWKTVGDEQLPVWIQGVEAELSEAILEHLITLTPGKRK